MSMKVSLKNFGVLKKAEFSLGDLTIITGKNNTGKTYATYALYGFLESWRQHIQIPISESVISDLRQEGIATINLSQYSNSTNQMLSEACERYSDQLDYVFAATEGRFSDSEFCFQIGTPNIRDKELEYDLSTHDEYPLFLAKRKGDEEMTVTLVAKEGEQHDIALQFSLLLTRVFIFELLFSDSFPNPFITSAERTGVTVFRKELNFARKHLLERMQQANKNVIYRDLLTKAYQNYPQPVEDNADFIGKLEDVAKRKSFITNEHPELLRNFSNIIGGNYSVAPNDQLHFIPKGQRLRLTMVESSSAVRSLLDLGIYLRHVAQRGDLLMVDEPELNLHPENQRHVARLFARLVNLGIKVFVTTHSDYIIKELNTLIMLKHDRPHLKRVAKENGYRDDELIRSDQVKVYMTQMALMPLEKGQKRRRRGHTLVPADIDPRFGIEARSFDETIDDMNRLLEDIVWGAE